jgi:phosphohistidine phosphatase
MLARVLVYLVRHADALGGHPDETRELSERGLLEARALAESLADGDLAPAVVLTSPLVRARQTAELIAGAAGAELRVDERLAPGATLESLRDAVGTERGPVAAVCHQPNCSEIAIAVTGSDPGFPPAGMLALRLEE